MHVINEKPGEEYLLLGNEAVVRGAIEAGIDIATQYPGTPSSEIGDTFWEIRNDHSYYYEYSTNEKVALEVAASAAASGLKSLTAMKHVGLNVAADSFVSTAYTGVKGGMVIVTADDPSMHSSQNEQDNRFYARMAELPLLEPATPAEAKEYTKIAFHLSNELELPIILRLTTRVSHTRGPVLFSEIDENKSKGFFKSNPKQFVPVPANSYEMHPQLKQKMRKAKELSEKSELNQKLSGNNIGMIASGVGASYAKEVRNKIDKDIALLTLGFSYPLPEDTIRDFLEGLDKVLLVEEVEPIVEKAIRSLIYDINIDVEVRGKLTGDMPKTHEYTPKIVREGLEKILSDKESEIKDKTGRTTKENEMEEQIAPPKRAPVLCPGCPHRHTYYAVKQAVKPYIKDGIEPIYPSDIGCYSLGLAEPFSAADYVLSMGASAGTSGGFAEATEQPVIAFIGDSTFFHSGITGLVNNIHNDHNMTLVVLDNSTTAMTGHQPHPGIFAESEDDLQQIKIENVVKGLGVGFLEIVDPKDTRQTEKTIKEAIDFEGVSVVISRSPCILLKGKDKDNKTVFEVDHDKCTGCDICIDTYACPAFYRDEENGKISIDTSLCTGCGVCTQVCKFNAIKEVE